MKQEENVPTLILLIQGLNSSQKSYYKKMSKRHADRNQALHLKLFKLIDGSKIVDENQLCQALKISKIHFSGLKKYLYKDILDSMIFEKRNIKINTQLHFLEEEIQILIQKGLFSLAQKLCKKGIGIAKKYEKYPSLILLNHLLNQVLEFNDYKLFQSNKETIFSEIEIAILHQDLLAKHKLLYHKIKVQTQYSWLRMGTEEIAEIGKLKEALNNLKPDSNFTPLTLLFYYNSLALCEYLMHENESCATSCNLIFNLWKQFPFLIEENPRLFLNSFNTTCYNNFLFKGTVDYKENLSAYSNLMESYLKNIVFIKLFEIIQFNTELKIYHKTAQYNELKILLDGKVKRTLSNTAELMSSPDRLSLLGSICISYFVLEQWDEAEELIALVKELNRNIIREDLLYFSSVFYLLILYEKQDWRRLDYAIEAAYHYLYSWKKFRTFEQKLILFLKKLFATSSKIEKQVLIKQFLEQLDKGNSPDKRLNFHYFNYYGWLESKLMGIKYIDYNLQKVTSSFNLVNYFE